MRASPSVAAVSFALLTLVAGGPARASDAPSAEEAQKVVDYYFNGTAGGPILLKLEACGKVENAKGDKQFACLEPVSGSVKKGTRVTAVMQFLVPKDGSYEDVSVQFLHDGTVRATKDLKLSGSIRYRSLAQETLSKPGKWEIKVLRAGKELQSVGVTAE